MRRPAETYEVIALVDGLTADTALAMRWKVFPARSRPQTYFPVAELELTLEVGAPQGIGLDWL